MCLQYKNVKTLWHRPCCQGISPFRRDRHMHQQDETKDVENAVMQIDTGFYRSPRKCAMDQERVASRKNFLDDVLPWPSLERWVISKLALPEWNGR